MKNVNFISTELRLDGNHICLDFINTIYDRRAKKLRDLILSQEDWVAWLKRVDFMVGEKGQADFDLKKIIELRELLYKIFNALILKQEPSKRDMHKFEKWVLKLYKSIQFSFENGTIVEHLQINQSDLNSYLLPIVKAAKELMLSKQINRIKDCGHCGWLYLDTSKNNSRRWCSMNTCGSQIKAQRYYRNKKKTTANNG